MRIIVTNLIILILTQASILQDMRAQTFWQKSNGPFGGNIRSAAVDINNTVYAATGGGIYSSTNNGDNWSKLSITIEGKDYGDTYVQALLVKGSSIYAATGSGCFSSMDLGKSWTEMDERLPSSVNAFAKSESGYLLAGTGSGIYSSKDEGKSWIKVTNAAEYMRVLSFAEFKGNIIAGGNRGRIVYSHDSGKSWTDTFNNLDSTDVTALAVSNNGRVIAGTSGGRIYSTQDTGKSWVLSDSIGGNSSVKAIAVTNSNYIYAGIGPNNADIPGDMQRWGIYCSTDNGSTWNKESGGLSNFYITSLATNKSGTVYAGCEGNIFRSWDQGRTWNKISNGMTASPVTEFEADTTGGIYAVTSDGICYSKDNGLIWKDINYNLPDVHISDIFLNKSGDMYAASVNGLYRLPAGKTLWEKITGNVGGNPVKLIAEDSKGRLYATDHYDVYLSEDLGSSWEKIPVVTTTYIYILTAYNNEIFLTDINNGLYRTINSGDTWVNYVISGRIISLGFAGNGDIYAGIIFSAAPDIIARSTDNGKSWKTQGGFNDNYFTSFVTDKNGYFYISLNDGRILTSMNNGASWKQLNSGLSRSSGYILGINSSGYIFTGTSANSSFRSSRTVTKALSIISPLGGEKWKPGTVHDIKWMSENIDTLRLELSIDNGSTWQVMRSFLQAGVKKYSWEVPNSPSVKCKIKLFDVSDPKIIALNDSVFTITAIPPVEVEEKDKKPAIENSLFQNYPNPFNPYTTIKYSLEKQGYVSLKIYNVIGKEIMTLVNQENSSGIHEIVFDATELPSGVYYYRIISGDFSDIRKLTVIK